MKNDNLFEIIKKLDDLINSQNVINHISINRYYLKEPDFKLSNNKEITKETVRLKAQFQKIFNSDTYQITYFDCYGRKIKTDTFENKRDFTIINSNKVEELGKMLREENIYIRGVGSNQIELMDSLLQNKIKVINLLKIKYFHS